MPRLQWGEKAAIDGLCQIHRFVHRNQRKVQEYSFMSRDPQQASTLFTQIDIAPGTQGSATKPTSQAGEQTELLHQILVALDRNNDLLEELVANATVTQRQRAEELKNWRAANPLLAEACKEAVDALARVQGEFLSNLTSEIRDNADAMEDGEFVFNEFVDRFGPRLAHLNGVLQMLSQLSAVPEARQSN
jgi:hypothetical protein